MEIREVQGISYPFLELLKQSVPNEVITQKRQLWFLPAEALSFLSSIDLEKSVNIQLTTEKATAFMGLSLSISTKFTKI